ncbi:acyltransferase [Limosilactobacillus caecicola]|uniref:acyltransferase n=1 Tax=Limosilactobacillus caecicola TaxID=2941332 RepID=UPI00203C8ACE|nr:acyltransferase [Limosilactobacillus caecicola]
MPKHNEQHVRGDIGDYLKVFACTAVIGQPIISLIIQGQPAHLQTNLGSVYDLIKYTAPAFIFGILYSTIRQSSQGGRFVPKKYYRGMVISLIVPTVIWTLIYLLLMPNLQQGHPYQNWHQFIWQFINGNAAPHLWYNTMMLQFALLIPFFWILHCWLGTTRWKGWLTLIGTAIFYCGWLIFYDYYVFHGPREHAWYLLDRVFVSFIIYGVYGVLAWNYRRRFNHWLLRYWPLILIGLAMAFVKTNHELRAFGWPIDLANATYYKPSMTFYSLMVICLVAVFSLNNQYHHYRKIQQLFHYLATLAYPAYLGNVFWEQLLWRGFALQNMAMSHPYLILSFLWVGTWLLSFACAAGVQIFQQHFIRR